jgi:RNA polymerase sigma-70 factor, ECF subfamily
MVKIFHKTQEQLNEEQVQITKAQQNIKDFEPLYNKYFGQIFRFIYQRVESKDEASDITSQVFLKALTNLKSYKYKAVPFSAWLYRIAINEISTQYSKNKKNRLVNIDTAQINELIEETNLELSEEHIKKIIEAIKKISGDDLMLLEMRFFENLTFKEIGDILKITENNAKVKVYRMVDKLKKQII